MFGAIMKKGGVLAGFDACMLLAALGAVLTAVFMKDRMPEQAAEKQGLKDVIPLVKESKALKAAYLSCPGYPRRHRGSGDLSGCLGRHGRTCCRL